MGIAGRDIEIEASESVYEMAQATQSISKKPLSKNSSASVGVGVGSSLGQKTSLGVTVSASAARGNGPAASPTTAAAKPAASR